MATDNWELQNKPKNVSLRARTLLPEDLGQLVSALLRDSRRSKPLPWDVFEQVCRVYEHTTLAHPAFAWEIDRYMDIAREKVARLLSKNTAPSAINLWDFPQPSFDLKIIQRAQKAAMLRQVGRCLRQSPQSYALPGPSSNVIYDPETGILGTMSSEKGSEQKCYAFLTDIILPEWAQFWSITMRTSGSEVFFIRVIQNDEQKVLYISGNDAHSLWISSAEVHDGIMSFTTWGDTPHVVMPDPKNTGKYIHQEGTLEWVFWWDIFVVKTKNFLVVRDTGWVFSCEVPSNFTPTVEKVGIKLGHKFQAKVRVWSKDDEAEPIAQLDCDTWFLSFSAFREIARQGS